MVGQVPCRTACDAAGEERRRERHGVVVIREEVVIVVVELVSKATSVTARWRRGRFAEGLWVVSGFLTDYIVEGGRVQPGWGHDVGAALFLEEEGEPEGEFGTVWRFER